MKLISARFPLPSELKHAYSAEEAVGVVKQHLDGRIALDELNSVSIRNTFAEGEFFEFRRSDRMTFLL